MTRLLGKKAIITGATTGIGFATAKQFIAEGATVIITGQNKARLANAAEQLGKRAIAVQTDVRSLVDLDNLAARAKEEFGSVDILFANAGVGQFSPLGQINEEFYLFCERRPSVSPMG